MSTQEQHAIPTLTSLPAEIQHQILYDALVVPTPIDMYPWGGQAFFKNPDISEDNPLIHLTPASCAIFYRHNTFRIGIEKLESFLHHHPAGPPLATRSASASTSLKPNVDTPSPSLPKDHVQHLVVHVSDAFHWDNHFDLAAALRLLLTCPKLKDVVIDNYGVRYEGVCEFRSTFRKIRDVCNELMERLGEERFKVKLGYLYGEFEWTAEDFKGKDPPPPSKKGDRNPSY